jgi:hypothetical protein
MPINVTINFSEAGAARGEDSASLAELRAEVADLCAQLGSAIPHSHLTSLTSAQGAFGPKFGFRKKRS